MAPKTRPYEHSGAKRRNIPTDRDEVYVDEVRERVPFSPQPAGTEGPRLSWRRGTDAQRIETDAMPLYIHEKVSPAAFVEQISRDGAEDEQRSFFADFNGLPQEARYDWYRYEGNWQNRIIRGNSVEVMASLAEKEGMAGQVQLIYFDPPYGIGFNSNYQGSTRKRTENSPPVEAASRRAFRDTYVDGLHSYMDTVFRTAVHARALLRDRGSFFLQIGTENVHRLSVVLDEVFGAENRVATIAFAKSGATSARNLPQVADWLLWYAKDKGRVTYHQLYDPLNRKEKLEHMSWHAMVELADGACRDLQPAERLDPDGELPEGARLFRRMRLASAKVSTTGRSDPYAWEGTVFSCPPGEQWRVDAAGMDHLARTNRLVAKGTLAWKRYEDEVPGKQINNLWRQQQSASDMHYVVETAEKTIERCLLMATDPGDLVLDPTCGSGTTAAVAERWGRRWITIDASAVPVALCRQRVLSSVHQWFLTRDDAEGGKEEAKLADRLDDYVSERDSGGGGGGAILRRGSSTSACPTCRPPISPTTDREERHCSSTSRWRNEASSGSPRRSPSSPIRRGCTCRPAEKQRAVTSVRSVRLDTMSGRQRYGRTSSTPWRLPASQRPIGLRAQRARGGVSTASNFRRTRPLPSS